MIRIKGKMDSVPEIWADRALPLEIEAEVKTEKGKVKRKYLLVMTKGGKLLLNKG